MSNNLICRECGMTIKPKEFHPYEFCILWKNGQDPRELYQRIIQRQSSDKQEEIERLKIALFTHESYDKSVSELYEENQRLRAALEVAKEKIKIYSLGRSLVQVNRCLSEIDEALTQPATHQKGEENE